MKHLTLILSVSTAISAVTASYKAPLYGERSRSVVPSSYIVELRSGCTLEKHLKHIGFSPNDSSFKKVIDLVSFSGVYIGEFPVEELNQIRSDECVAGILHDVYLNDTEDHLTEQNIGKRRDLRNMLDLRRLDTSGQNSSGQQPSAHTLDPRVEGWSKEIQTSASWNLRMMALPGVKEDLSGSEHVYPYVNGAGTGVDVYLFEHGIHQSHPEIRDRTTYFRMAKKPVHEKLVDKNHGTSIASIIAGKTLGIAKNANLRMVTYDKMSGFEEGLAAVSHEHGDKLENPEDYPGWTGSIIVTGSGFSYFRARYESRLVTPFRFLDRQGIITICAAGNKDGYSGKDARLQVMPCVLPGTICVGAVNGEYNRWTMTDGGSNYGDIISLWAPGQDIPVATGPEGYGTDYGTSFASPHVAGAAAIIQGFEGARDIRTARDSWNLKTLLLSNSLYGYVEPVKQSRNLLSNTGIELPRQFEEDQPFRPADTSLLLAQEIEHKKQTMPLRSDGSGKVDMYYPYSRDAKHPTLRCYRKGNPLRITKDQAQDIWLRTRWEAGHVNRYQGRGKFSTFVPCVGRACVYMKAKDPNQDYFFPDGTPIEETVFHIMVFCADRPIEDPEGPIKTGGRMPLNGMPGMVIHLSGPQSLPTVI